MHHTSWPSIEVVLSDGTSVAAIAPVIISASRATDIPAFFMGRFMDALSAGSVVWTNPFNAQRSYVSFAHTRACVFWTKNPRALLARVAELDRLGLTYYVQYTLNDYEQAGYEPGVPPLLERIDTFKELSKAIGVERVVWRFDPLVLGAIERPEALLRRLERIGDLLHPYTRRLIVSFVDLERYARVKQRLARLGNGARECLPDEIQTLAVRLGELGRAWGIDVQTCAESQDLRAFGISAAHCIDDALLRTIGAHDPTLLKFLGAPSNLPMDDPWHGHNPALRDKHQRKACGCIVSKDIGQYGTCRHGCVYCYAAPAKGSSTQE